MTPQPPETPAGPSPRHGVRAALGRPHPSWAVLAVMLGGWSLVFGYLVWLRHERFGSFAFDMGIFDQAIWLLASGRPQFITVRGLEVFGHHASVGYYLLVPFYLLGAGPHFLNLLQVGLTAAGAVAVYLLGRTRLANPWLALPPVAAFLLHPSTQFLQWELFHPEVVAVPFLFFAYLALVHRRWVPYAVLLLVAMSWKEDVMLAVVVLGLALMLAGEVRIGAATALAAGTLFFLSTRLLIPMVSGMQPFYGQFFGDIGNSPLAVLETALTRPELLLERVTGPEARRYLMMLMSPYAFLPLAAPAVLALGLPQLLINLLSVQTFTREITFHYAALPLAALTLGLVEGIAVISAGRVPLQRFLVGLVAATALASTVAWGPSPIGARFREGYWALDAGPRQEAKRAAVALVPSDAPVSATYELVPHLTHRPLVYMWPNPWRAENWGVAGERTHDPEVVEWIVLDLHLVAPDAQPILDRLLVGDFEVRMDREGVLVAERTG